MNRSLTRTDRAVRRHNAQNFMLIVLISFSSSVILTRAYLTLTGFPKIGGGEFHFAHLLWGGLLLFLAALLMLTFSNHWVYSVGAVMTGTGVGLFIDEVGKFITNTNDYFYPLAIPIIYAFFLMTVLLYLRSRRPVSTDPRNELYRCLEMFQELLDHDLEHSEKNELEQRLNQAIAKSTSEDLTVFAQSLLTFLQSKEVQLAPDRLTWTDKLIRRARAFERNHIGHRRLKILLTVGLGILGVLAFLEIVALITAAITGSQTSIAVLTAQFSAERQIKSVVSLNWYVIQLAMQGVIGALLLAASVLLIVGKDKQGNDIGYVALLFSLTIVNLLIFYFEQFGNIVLTLFELLLLLGIMQYRNQYLVPPTQERQQT